MTSAEIRNTTYAVDNGVNFWLREIAAQLADLNSKTAFLETAKQLEALETTVRMIGIHLQKDDCPPAKSPESAKAGRQ